MSKDAEIKDIIEAYLSLESDLRFNFNEREAADRRYRKLLAETDKDDNVYTLQQATPILHAYDDSCEFDAKIHDLSRKLNNISTKIEEWIKALNGASLHVRFDYDTLDHRAGDHTFFMENGQLRAIHKPVS